MSLSYLLERKDLRFIIFGGKGGVGKTTCAAATGLYMASKDRKTLVFSADPAHSLSDIFHLSIGDKIVQINGIDDLYALEISAEEEYRLFREGAREEIKEAIKGLTQGMDMPFDREIMRNLMEITPPGLDELMALTKMSSLIKSSEYDLIVIDTAAGAHVTRLLETPAVLRGWFTETLHLLDKYRHVAYLPKTRDLIEDLKNDVDLLIEMLTDPRRTEFVAVTIPEAMGTHITEMMIEGLALPKIHAETIIVNNVILSRVACEYCATRRGSQIKRIKALRERFPGYRIIEAPSFPQQVSGVQSLMSFAKAIYESGNQPEFPTRVPEERIPSISESPRLKLPRWHLQFILFGGKGGVGKTTCATSTAIYMANQGRKILVVSTDPQHSLHYSIDQRLGDGITPIEDVQNLYALEIDAKKIYEDWMEENREEILEIASESTFFEKEDVAGFLDASLGPGIDEFMALVEISNLIKRGEYDLYVFDTAPTGHTIRLLQLPDVISKWANLLVTMRSKTQYIATRFFGRRIRTNADLFLESLLKDIREVKASLTNSIRTEFIAVTTVEDMAIKETERLVAALKSLRIHVKQMIVNGLIPPNLDCMWCASRVKTQQEGLRDLRGKFPHFDVITMPLFSNEVRGIQELKKFGKTLFDGRQEEVGLEKVLEKEVGSLGTHN